jgi:hypothetical protein
LVSATLSLTLGNRVIIANRKLRLQHRMSQILEEKLEQLTRELSEAQDQLKATSEVLRIISSSPADVALAARNHCGKRGKAP